MKEAVIDLIERAIAEYFLAEEKVVENIRYGKVLGMLAVARELEIISEDERETIMLNLDDRDCGV